MANEITIRQMCEWIALAGFLNNAVTGRAATADDIYKYRKGNLETWYGRACRIMGQGADDGSCPHHHRQGNNNGMTCMDCGRDVAGYGCFAPYIGNCVHEWYAEPHMKVKMCTYCQREAPNEKYDPVKDNWKDCPECKANTEHELVLYNPNHPEDGHAWQCKTCKELTDIFEPLNNNNAKNKG